MIAWLLPGVLMLAPLASTDATDRRLPRPHAVSDTITGSVIVGRDTIPLRHVVARRIATGGTSVVTQVLLTTAPIPDSLLRDAYEVFYASKSGLVEGVALEIDAERGRVRASMLSNERFGGVMVDEEGPAVMPRVLTDTRVEGRFALTTTNLDNLPLVITATFGATIRDGVIAAPTYEDAGVDSVQGSVSIGADTVVFQHVLARRVPSLFDRSVTVTQVLLTRDYVPPEALESNDALQQAEKEGTVAGLRLEYEKDGTLLSAIMLTNRPKRGFMIFKEGPQYRPAMFTDARVEGSLALSATSTQAEPIAVTVTWGARVQPPPP